MTPHRLLALFVLVLSAPSLHAQRPDAVEDPIFDAMAVAPEKGEGKWKGSLGAGLSLNRGSENSTQASFSGDATRAMRDSRLIGRALLIRNSSEGERSSDLANLEARGERNFGDEMFGFGDVMIERDLKNDLRLRQSFGAGFGRRIYQQKDLALNAYVGASYAVANFYEANDGRGFEPLLGQDVSYRLSDTSALSQRFVVFPNTVGPGGIRTAFQADITTRIADRFGLQLAVLHKYREHIPAGDAHHDLVLFTGLTSSF